MASKGGNGETMGKCSIYGETDGLKELQDRVKVYIDQGKKEKCKLKERTDELMTRLKTAIDDLATISGEYRDLLDNQNEILESIHEELSNYKGVENGDTGVLTVPTQVQGSESPRTSRCFISSISTPASQPPNERIQLQKTDPLEDPLHVQRDVQRVVYQFRKEKKTRPDDTLVWFKFSLPNTT